MNFKSIALTLAIALLPAAQANAGVRHDEGIGFYIGLDGRTTVPSGAYAGLPEANAGRLTLLFDHGDHFHGIGTYSYSGPAPHPGVLDTNANNRIPEVSSLEPGLSLTAGSGTYAGRLRSSVGSSEYSYLGMAPLQSLSGFAPGSEEAVLFNSSAGRWSGSQDGVTVGLKLLSASSGLTIGTESVTNLFSVSDTILLGAGNAWTFKPVYSLAGGAAPGTYSAELQLVNLNPLSDIGDSGRFYFDFAVAAAPVPEPETYAMMLCGLGLVGLGLHRRARKEQAKALRASGGLKLA
jgi:hypothetical protein